MKNENENKNDFNSLGVFRFVLILKIDKKNSIQIF